MNSNRFVESQQPRHCLTSIAISSGFRKAFKKFEFIFNKLVLIANLALYSLWLIGEHFHSRLVCSFKQIKVNRNLRPIESWGRAPVLILCCSRCSLIVSAQQRFDYTSKTFSFSAKLMSLKCSKFNDEFALFDVGN